MVYLSGTQGAGEDAKKDGSNGHFRPQPAMQPLQPAPRRPSQDGEVQEVSSGEDSDEREGRIRVGKDYQALIPAFVPVSHRRPEQLSERALLVWSPSSDISNMQLDDYIMVAKEKYGYNAEQALGMLFWHKHDLERAIQDLANFTPFPDEWSVEDKVLFEQAFQFHGKSFHRIRQMLPDKTIAQLVKYYYGWKKTRTRTSLMDRQARKLQAAREEQQLGGNSSNSSASTASSSTGGAMKSEASAASTSSPAGAAPATPDSKANSASDTSPGLTSVLQQQQQRRQSGSDVDDEDEEDRQKPRCFNCGIVCHVTHPTPKGQMCGTCHQYFARTGRVRPTTGPVASRSKQDGGGGGKMRASGGAGGGGSMRNANRPPRGMHINHDDLVALATGPVTQGEALLKSMDREIISYKRLVQNNKQYLSLLHRRVFDRSVPEDCPYKRPGSTGGDGGSAELEGKINAKWSNDELLLGVRGVRKFGKNFKVIAEILGTKSERHVRSFFDNYKRRYNLDAVLKEYEAEHGPSSSSTAADEDDGKAESKPASPGAGKNGSSSAAEGVGKRNGGGGAIAVEAEAVKAK